MNEIKYYIPLPVDKFGNVPKGRRVVGAQEIDGELVVVEPATFPWRTINSNRWQECEGPARDLDFYSWANLVGFEIDG